MERKFPLQSPRIADIVVKRSGKVRRAKLYFLRDRTGKAVRLKERAPARLTTAQAAAVKTEKREIRKAAKKVKLDAKAARASAKAAASENSSES